MAIENARDVDGCGQKWMWKAFSIARNASLLADMCLGKKRRKRNKKREKKRRAIVVIMVSWPPVALQTRRIGLFAF